MSEEDDAYPRVPEDDVAREEPPEEPEPSEPEVEEGAPAPVDLQAADLLNRFRNGAGWFFWVAGLSILNSALTLSGSTWIFIFGLGVTQILDAFVVVFEAGTVGKLLVFMFNCLVAAFFVVIGLLARKRHLWAFWVGMILYALDGVLLLLVSWFGDLLGFGFHVFVLFGVYRGLRACRDLSSLEQPVDATSEAEESEA